MPATPLSRRARCRAGLTPLLALALALLVGCQAAPPTRAIWVTRWDYVTEADVRGVIRNCHDAGFDTLLFQVRGNGTAFYRSALEPWADELGGADPGFDPLAVAVAEAHRRGLELHAWVNVMPAWRGPDPPRDPEQLYHKRPEWFWYDAAGTRQPMHHRVGDRERSWYVSLNPCLPEVRAYLVEVFREIVSGYAVDGLHLDYIRFPNEPVLPGERIPDYPRDARTLALFAAETGATPDGDPEAWNRWRTAKVTALVRAIRAMVDATRPGTALSAAVGTDPVRSLKYHRDGRGWAAQGLIDIAFPMNYKPSLREFDAGLEPWLPLVPGTRVVPGLRFHPRLSLDEGIAVTTAQVRRALAETAGFCLFSYAALFGGGPAEAEARRRRRAALRPFLPDRAVISDPGG